MTQFKAGFKEIQIGRHNMVTSGLTHLLQITITVAAIFFKGLFLLFNQNKYKFYSV